MNIISKKNLEEVLKMHADKMPDGMADDLRKELLGRDAYTWYNVIFDLPDTSRYSYAEDCEDFLEVWDDICDYSNVREAEVHFSDFDKIAKISLCGGEEADEKYAWRKVVVSTAQYKKYIRKCLR